MPGLFIGALPLPHGGDVRCGMEKLSIIVPCLNEEQCIRLFYERVNEVLRTIPVEHEYIFVDDGSCDSTRKILRELSDGDERVQYIAFSRNFGKEAAMYAGMKAATGSLVTIMDCDLQDPPELLKDMYDGIADEPRIRSAFARLFYKIINRFTEVEIVDGARDFRMMTRKMTDAVLSIREVDRFSKELFSWVGFKTKWLEYENVERAGGSTKWSFKKLTDYAVNGIESATSAPLRVNLWAAILFMLAALGFAVADIAIAASKGTVTELFILLPVLFFMAAIILFGMFIMGEYLRKIFGQVKARPMYIISETEKDKDK